MNFAKDELGHIPEILQELEPWSVVGDVVVYKAESIGSGCLKNLLVSVVAPHVISFVRGHFWEAIRWWCDSFSSMWEAQQENLDLQES